MKELKQYDVRCPRCGAINRGLYLKETNGSMECIVCGSVSKISREQYEFGNSMISCFPVKSLTVFIEEGKLIRQGA